MKPYAFTKPTREDRDLARDPIVQEMAAGVTPGAELECFDFMVTANREYMRRCNTAGREPKCQTIGGVARAIRAIVAEAHANDPAPAHDEPADTASGAPAEESDDDSQV